MRAPNHNRRELSRARAWHPWLMQLRSPDGTSMELRIAGYQFPGHQASVADFALNWLEVWAKIGPPPGGKWARDWDANWLQVCGSITLADGKTWAFEQPCLTTWDAQELGSWLHEVAAGTVPVLVENSATSAELGFHAICRYSLISPASLVRRWIRVAGCTGRKLGYWR
jgi:hypothetical protein